MPRTLSVGVAGGADVPGNSIHSRYQLVAVMTNSASKGDVATREIAPSGRAIGRLVHGDEDFPSPNDR